ncbi:DUF1150 family protein [Albidovulum sp.]|uniref:DUF1150 family protein n=1 Tax=Albidovulum sp. TaxID=1872424 RepID=UPI001DDF2509|nr:DUF1150 domain-containing protein [Paracoccaceae bacterium]MCC0047402.1 DUF1150 domain-containing protein [Defluviimonas sp.]HPE26949.1 DUF1150 family protein [Albidovulum sp.]MCB2120232.1 DUF1150 domain-containing protein [Paracoccaceae bacterium]MCB2121230.1 DUF1150 domain-containing protein [Paracoccaceae bacterium]
MHTKFDFGPESGERIVYVRPVAVADLPDEVREQVPGVTTLYAVCDEDGEQLALVRDRRTAFLLARENDMAPVNVH